MVAGGSKPRAVSLSRVVAPEGFDGVWSCCLLGYGGWGCAYRCERGGEVVVFKVQRGFEPIMEGGFIPTVDRKLLERIAEKTNTTKALKIQISYAFTSIYHLQTRLYWSTSILTMVALSGSCLEVRSPI